MIDRNLRIVFMGTPVFAVASLQYLLDAGYTVVGVVTAPDKPGGRGMKQMISSPVKKFAEVKGLTILQPANLKSKVFLEELKSLRADLQVVVAFRMLPEVVWNMPVKGTLNLHGSLLPSYRGAAPIQWAIIKGEKITGVTTFLLQHEIDTGMILLQREIPILESDDAKDLHDRMMDIGAELVVATIDWIVAGKAVAIQQDESKVSHAPKISHEDGHIDWNQNAKDIYNLIRGLSLFPGAWTILDGAEVKIWKSRIQPADQTRKPGTVWVKDKSLFIQSKDNAIELIEIQMAGKKRMKARDFLLGYKIKDWSVT